MKQNCKYIMFFERSKNNLHLFNFLIPFHTELDVKALYYLLEIKWFYPSLKVFASAYTNFHSISLYNLSIKNQAFFFFFLSINLIIWNSLSLFSCFINCPYEKNKQIKNTSIYIFTSFPIYLCPCLFHIIKI